MLLTYATGAAAWGGAVLLIGTLAIHAGGHPPPRGDWARAFAVAALHAALWPVMLPVAVAGQVWRLRRGD